jgi:hypothetical protein
MAMKDATSDSPATRPDAIGMANVSEFFRFYFCQRLTITAPMRNEKVF